jgi:4a-hydroxytetrahydrobiopterin dehydratase
MTNNSLRLLRPTEVVTQLSQMAGWVLVGDGDQVAIEKTYHFPDYGQTMIFANAVAFMAQTSNHHPDMVVCFSHCTVRYRTHDVGGLSQADFDAATKVDTLLGKV